MTTWPIAAPVAPLATAFFSITATRHPGARAFESTCRADNARAENRDVAGCAHFVYPHAEGVVRVEQERGFRSYICGSSYARDDFVAVHADASFEDRAEDACLSPDFAGRKFSICVEAGHLGAGSGAAGRAVVGLSGAQDKIGAVGVGANG